jgi:hypothetical protein
MSNTILSQANEALVQGSRSAIIESRFSPAYFDQHFRLVDAINKPGDIRVIWKFSLNGYEVLINDAIGYYTESRKRVYVHSVKNTLVATKDIPKTISRRRAETLMTACIGNHTDKGVAFMRLSPKDKTALYLTASAVSAHRPRKEEKERETEDQRQGNSQIDQPDKEEVQKRPRILGYVNLETGKCSKGTAVIAP